MAMARSDGAETAHRIGIPATAAFWTISKLTRPETMTIRSLQRQGPGHHLRSDHLVEGVVPSDVLADRHELAVRR